MDFSAFMETNLFNWLVLPLAIFLMRVIDVTVGTIRIIYVSKSMIYLAPIFGFVEVLVWLISITQIMQNLDNYITYVAFAGGFAAGNFVGIYIENKLAVGMVAVRVIAPHDAADLTEALKNADCGVTSVAARGISGRVRLLFSIIKRKDLPRIIKLIQEHNPKAFITVEDVRSAQEGYFGSVLRGPFSWSRNPENGTVKKNLVNGTRKAK